MPQWYPLGPDFVFHPRNADYTRISRRNAWPSQGLVKCIALENENVIYTIVRPTNGGALAFKTENGGKSWKPISETLQKTDINFEPNLIVIDPNNSNKIYLLTWDSRQIIISENGGETWGPPKNTGLHIEKLIIDKIDSSMYAAAREGLYHYLSDAAGWEPKINGDVRSLIRTEVGTDIHYYAGVSEKGIYHVKNPHNNNHRWRNLNDQANPVPGLPINNYSREFNGHNDLPNFTWIKLDYCTQNPNRIYAIFFQKGRFRIEEDNRADDDQDFVYQIYRTDDSITLWLPKGINFYDSENTDTHHSGTYHTIDAYGDYCYEFVVAPNSRGTNNDDILFYGNTNLYRSIDSGQNWTTDKRNDKILKTHADQHVFVFYPTLPIPGYVPVMYVGNDGGISRSIRYADPTFPSVTNQSMEIGSHEFSDAEEYDATPENINEGMLNVAIYKYCGVEGYPSMGFIGCQDTGMAAAWGTLTWIGFGGGDNRQMAATPGQNGIIIWGEDVVSGGMIRYLNNDNILNFNKIHDVYLPGSHNVIILRSNMIIDPQMVNDQHQCLCLGYINDVGFTSTFLIRVNHEGLASVISQSFPENDTGSGNIICKNRFNNNIIFTTSKRKLWMNSNNSAHFTEITIDKPSDSDMRNIEGITIDASGTIFIILSQSTTMRGIRSPLFKIIENNRWQIVECNNMPTETSGDFSKLLSDPVNSNVLYTSYHGVVYKIRQSSNNRMEWEILGGGLPVSGLWLYKMDLWIANFGSNDEPNILLRAATAIQGVWEISLSKEDNPNFIYMRDHILDHPLINPSIDWVDSPYKQGEQIAHWQSADIKIDALRTVDSLGQELAIADQYFQTDPESSDFPINGLSHVVFNQMKDNSQKLLYGGSANVHVQVQNRGTLSTPATRTHEGVNVWAIWCNASAGLPALNAIESSGAYIPAPGFDFWSQFRTSHDPDYPNEIRPSLPEGSPWHSIRDNSDVVKRLSEITPTSPKIASWQWTVPQIENSSDTGHYCVVVFIHSEKCPITNQYRSFDVDDIVPKNRQVAQKNLHITDQISASGSSEGSSGGSNQPPPPDSPSATTEFHNPGSEGRTTDLVLDFTTLPKNIQVHLQLTRINSKNPFEKSAKGIIRIYNNGIPAKSGFGIGELFYSLASWLLRLANFFLAKKYKISLPTNNETTSGFIPVVYQTEGGQKVVFPDILLKGYGMGKVKMQFVSYDKLEPGEEYRFNVYQKVNDKVVGGSTYVLPVSGTKERINTYVSAEERE